MNYDAYSILGSIIQFGTGIAIAIFTWLQWKINKRQDYVAITVIPFVVDNNNKLQIRNTGKLNLYLHKYEVGGTNELYEKPRMLACGSDTFFIVPVPNNYNVEMPMKLYLTDDSKEKYISTGAVIIDIGSVPIPQSIPLNTQTQEQQAVQQFAFRGNARAWSYKTERFDWKI